jgi:hypothetical protein
MIATVFWGVYGLPSKETARQVAVLDELLSRWNFMTFIRFLSTNQHMASD